MAISFVNSAQAGTSSVTLPTGIAAGDVILVFGYRNTTTAPSLPTGYTSAFTQSANGNSERCCWKFAVGTESSTSLTVTNANVIKVGVYRGVGVVGGASSSTAAASTSLSVTGIGTMRVTNGTSWAVSMFGSLQTTSATTPASTTIRGTFQTGTTSSAMMVDSNGGVSSWGAHTSTLGASAAAASGSVELVAQTSLSTFTEPFNTGSQNTTLWGGNFGTLSWAPAFTITNPISYTGYGGMATNYNYDATGASVAANVASVGNQSLASIEFIPVELHDAGTTNRVFILITANTLSAYKTVAGAQTFLAGLTYNSTTMKYMRLRELSGTTYWEYSADGITYSTLFSVANPITMTSVFVGPSLGTYAAEASSTTAVITDYNVTPTPSGTPTNLFFF